MNSFAIRLIALGLFLVAMPLRVVQPGRGFFTNADGWHGYETAYFWPMAVVEFGAWWLIPVVISNAYGAIGMWLKGLPNFIHFAGWLMFFPSSLVLCTAGEGLAPGALVLLVALIISGIGPYQHRARVKSLGVPATP